MDQNIKKNWQNAELIVFATLIIIAFLIGHQLGYSKGYTYVLDYEKEYMERNCLCMKQQPLPQQQFNMTEIAKVLENSSEKP